MTSLSPLLVNGQIRMLTHIFCCRNCVYLCFSSWYKENEEEFKDEILVFQITESEMTLKQKLLTDQKGYNVH